MSSSPKKISVITINLNNIEGLRKTIASVAAQESGNFEFLIIDGGSKDGSVDLIKEKSALIDFWESATDNGIYDAMNKGIQHSNGMYVQFLNSGDTFVDPGVFNKVDEIIGINNNIDIFYGDIVLKNELQIRSVKKFKAEPDLYFFREQIFNHQASFIKRSLFTSIGKYPDNRFKLASDYWLFLSAFMRNYRFSYLNFPVIEYDLTGISSLRMDHYRKEMSLVWDELVPSSISDLMNENKSLREKFRFTIIANALRINDRFQRIKNRWSL